MYNLIKLKDPIRLNDTHPGRMKCMHNLTGLNLDMYKYLTPFNITSINKQIYYSEYHGNRKKIITKSRKTIKAFNN